MTAQSFGLGSAQVGVWAAEEVSAGADAFVISQVLWFDGDIEVSSLAEAVSVAGAEVDVLALRVAVGVDGVPVLVGGGELPRVEVSDVALTDEQIRVGSLARCRALGGDPERFVARSFVHRRVSGGWAWEFVAHVDRR